MDEGETEKVVGDPGSPVCVPTTFVSDAHDVEVPEYKVTVYVGVPPVNETVTVED